MSRPSVQVCDREWSTKSEIGARLQSQRDGRSSDTPEKSQAVVILLGP